ncbi:MAG: LDCC motif putative metal-binding protein [Salinivirgaceae bacterium]
MKDFDKIIKYRFNKSLNESEISKLRQQLKEVEGIDSFEISSKYICIEYLPFKLSKESIQETLNNIGYPVKIEKKKKKGLFARFIDKLAKSNKETFGNQKLDCCDLKKNN